MNERIIKLGLESGMLNYVDHETPRHYFLCGHADEECLEKFAELIVRECANYIRENYDSWDAEPLAHNMEVDFGLHGDYAE